MDTTHLFGHTCVIEVQSSFHGVDSYKYHCLAQSCVDPSVAKKDINAPTKVNLCCVVNVKQFSFDDMFVICFEC